MKRNFIYYFIHILIASWLDSHTFQTSLVWNYPTCPWWIFIENIPYFLVRNKTFLFWKGGGETRRLPAGFTGCTVHVLIVRGGQGGCHGLQILKNITPSKRVQWGEDEVPRDIFIQKRVFLTFCVKIRYSINNCGFLKNNEKYCAS